MDFPFSDLPFHQQLLAMLTIGCAVVCILCAGAGAWWRRKAPEVPPLYPGSNFPQRWAQVLMWVYLAAFTYFTVLGIVDPPQPQATEEQPQHSVVVMLLGLFLQYIFYLPLAVLLALTPAPEQRGRTFLGSIPSIFAGLFFILLFSCLYSQAGLDRWLQEVTQCPAQQTVVDSFATGDLSGKIIMAVAACIFAPVAEECFFRGFVYGTLRKHSGALAAALASSLFFASVHAAVIQFLPLALFAFVQCILYERFRTLWVPMALHSLFNLTNLVIICICGI